MISQLITSFVIHIHQEGVCRSLTEVKPSLVMAIQAEITSMEKAGDRDGIQ